MSLFKTAIDGLLTPLEVVASLPEWIRSFKSESLVDYTATTRVEPVMLFGQDIFKHPSAEDVAQTCLNIFSSMYLQAVALSTVIKGVDVRRRLDKFNPNREMVNPIADALAQGIMLSAASTEEFKFGLPTIAQVSTEARAGSCTLYEGASAQNQTSMKSLMENNNLAVGKIMDVKVMQEDQEITVPVNVRLNTVPCTGRNLKNIISAGHEDTSFKIRWDQFKAGKKRFWLDIVCCVDILDKHRKAIIGDNTGLYMKSLEAANKNKLTGFLTANPSAATASNIYVISEETALDVERELNIKLLNYGMRQKIFERSPLMLLVVMDRGDEMATFYFRNQQNETSYSFSALSRSVSNNSQDIMKILGQLQAGAKSNVSLF